MDDNDTMTGAEQVAEAVQRLAAGKTACFGVTGYAVSAYVREVRDADVAPVKIYAIWYRDHLTAEVVAGATFVCPGKRAHVRAAEAALAQFRAHLLLNVVDAADLPLARKELF